MSKQNMLRYDCSFRRLKRRSKTKNFLSISFSASRRRGGGRRRRENARKFFGFCTRESASVSEAHCLAPPRNRSVRSSFKPPRAPRVRSGFAQRLIHHRKKKLPNPKGGKKSDRPTTTLSNRLENETPAQKFVRGFFFPPKPSGIPVPVPILSFSSCHHPICTDR